jgi:bifunctional non-homologous end joining protein LigD
MGLNQYRAKRRFSGTSEPPGNEPLPPESGEAIFVIQKHQASHLHWDLRLQEGGLLKSWAVPKELPTESGVRRLAVEVEDHPELVVFQAEAETMRGSRKDILMKFAAAGGRS